MPGHNQRPTDDTPRRSVFRRIAAMSALGLIGFGPTPQRAQAAESDGLDWPGPLKGRHKQVFDVYGINGGSPLGFANNFLTPNESATAVLVFRHNGTPYALGSAIWEKYKIGETFHIIDRETKAPAVKNPWFQPKPGVLSNDNAALDRLLARSRLHLLCRGLKPAASQGHSLAKGCTNARSSFQPSALSVPTSAPGQRSV